MNEPVVYEITNPSDPYTIEGDDLAVVCVATILLGHGAYGLCTANGERAMPVLLFGGHELWFTEKFGSTLEELLPATPYARIADCLDTVLIGSFRERQEYHRTLQLIDDPEKRLLYSERWHEGRRSSLNDIGGMARRLAKALRQ